MSPLSQSLFEPGEMNVRRLHADKAGLPGGKAKADNGKEDKRYPANLCRNTREMRHRQNERCHCQTQHRANLTCVNHISLEKTRNTVDIMVIKPHVVVAEQIDLRPSNAARL